MARVDCTQRTYCSEHTLKFLRILVDVQQRYGASKLRLVKRDHVPQSEVLELVTPAEKCLLGVFFSLVQSVEKTRV